VIDAVGDALGVGLFDAADDLELVGVLVGDALSDTVGLGVG
jgi:hypothetical protein